MSDAFITTPFLLPGDGCFVYGVEAQAAFEFVVEIDGGVLVAQDRKGFFLTAIRDGELREPDAHIGPQLHRVDHVVSVCRVIAFELELQPAREVEFESVRTLDDVRDVPLELPAWSDLRNLPGPVRAALLCQLP